MKRWLMGWLGDGQIKTVFHNELTKWKVRHGRDKRHGRAGQTPI